MRSGGIPEKLGFNGPMPEHIFANCVARMKRWVVLAQETLRAEIPDFEAVYSFRIFNFADNANNNHSVGGQVQTECVHALALSGPVLEGLCCVILPFQCCLSDA